MAKNVLKKIVFFSSWNQGKMLLKLVAQRAQPNSCQYPLMNYLSLCLFSFRSEKVVKPQISQTKSVASGTGCFSSICSLKLTNETYFWPHNSQMCSLREALWTPWCDEKILLNMNPFLQISQKNFFSACSECFVSIWYFKDWISLIL